MSTQITDNPAAALTALDASQSNRAFDGVDLQSLAGHLGTPLHVYSASAIEHRIHQLRDALQGKNALICYAVKANANRAILQLIAAAGLSADIVSAGELQRSVRAGIPPNRIVFSGVGKTAEEISEALSLGIHRFNVESHDELLTLQRLAQAAQVTARAAVRINPDVDAATHAKISTGRAENKFGVSIDEARRWFADRAQLPNVQLDGLHVHIGSQILKLKPFRLALGRVAALQLELEQAGHPIRSIDVGGGLGVCYRHGEDRPVDAADYVGVIRQALADFQKQLVLEPGRWLVAEAGVMLTRVIRVKQGDSRQFLIIDTAMNDLQRPSLYDAWHEIEPLDSSPRAPVRYDIVGPVCETGDTFARNRALPACEAGDLLMIKATGAYGASMASTYNSRPLAAEVMVRNGQYAVVRRRQSLDELIAGERPATHWQTT